MKQTLLIILLIFSIRSSYSQSYNGLDHAIDVTYDITADQYEGIKLYVLKHGNITNEFTDINANVVHYSFDNTDVYIVPCNLDPMVQVDSIMPAYNYCQLAFKIKFGSSLYNSFFQYMYLKLIGNQIILQPVYNDPEPEYTMKREDLIAIVQNISDQIISKE